MPRSSYHQQVTATGSSAGRGEAGGQNYNANIACLDGLTSPVFILILHDCVMPSKIALVATIAIHFTDLIRASGSMKLFLIF